MSALIQRPFIVSILTSTPGRLTPFLAAALLLASGPRLAAGQDFTAQISPNPVTLSAGGPAATVTVSTTPTGAFTLPITYSFTGLPAGISTGGPQVVSAPYPDVTFPFSATAAVAPGTYMGTLAGSTAGGPTTTFPVTVIVLQPDFILTAAPVAVSLAPGQSTTVMVSATGSGGFSGSINVTGTAPADLSLNPASFAVAAGGTEPVLVTASPAAPTGVSMVTFAGTAPGVTGTRTAMVTVTVAPAPSAPVIQAITPPSVVTGTRSNVLRLIGMNFQPGAVVSSASPDVIVTSSRVLGPNLAEADVAVRPGSTPGPYRLDLRNPDGGLTSGGAMLLVYPAGSLTAPLSVTAVRVVSPRPWEVIEPGQELYPRAQLATTGLGTVVGTWLLDGIPFDRFTRVVTGGFPVEVRANVPIPQSITGERQLELVIESPASVPSQVVPVLQGSASRTALRVLSPAPGDAVDPASALFRWTLVPGASGYLVEVESGAPGDDTGERPTGTRRVTKTSWQPEPGYIEGLGPGEKRFRVRAVYPGEIFDDPTEWHAFVLIEDGSGDGSDPAVGGSSPAAPESSEAGSGPRLADGEFAPAARLAPGASLPGRISLGRLVQTQDPGGEFVLAAQGTFTASDINMENDPPPLGRLAVSGQVDVRERQFDLQATADIAGSLDLGDPWDGRQEGRNWMMRTGVGGTNVRQEITFGYAPPSFFDQAEFLTVMSASGAVQGTFQSPAGNLSYFRSLDLSGNSDFNAFEPSVDAAAYEYADDGGRYLFRAMFLHADDPGFGDFSFGGQGDAFGAMGVVDLGPELRLAAEAATGDFEPAPASLEQARDGAAFRLSADGTSGTVGYGLTVGHTAEGFANPANPGFTPGGVSDRTRVEARVSKTLGQAYLSGTYSHVRGGVAVAAEDPDATQNAATLSFSMPVSQRVSLSVNGNVSKQSGDAVASLGLPETDRTQKGATLSLSETLGAFSFTQSVNWQDFSDVSFPISDQQVIGLNLFGSGMVGPYLLLSANVSNTQIEGAPEVGTTDQFLLSLQPALRFADVGFELSPRAAFTRIDNEELATETKSDLYQVVARWTPMWVDGHVSLEVAGDWSRSWTQLETEPPPFRRQVVFTLGVNWQTSGIWPGGTP